MATNIWFWVIFNAFILFLLALDLGLFHRKAHAVSLKEAGFWSAVWVTISLLFGAGLYLFAGSQPALQFLTGYLIEKSLSVDNIFVFVLLFSYFNVPLAYQHRVLFWGILGALLMRGVLIAAGAYLLSQFHWVIYIFGAFLIFTGIRMAFHQEQEIDAERNVVVRALRRVIPITPHYHQDRFFIREAGRLLATPLLVVLLIVETTDLIFALDSIPAIFAVTQDPFLVYTSNVFAILGLRAMYFLLAGVVQKFRFLKVGLSAILVFVGTKMLVADLFHVPTQLSLLVIAAVLTISIVASLVLPERLAPEAKLPAQ